MQTSTSTLAELENRLFGLPLIALQSRLAYDDRLTRLWGVIESNFMDVGFDLDKASRECGMSKNNLNCLLKKITGCHTCYELLTAYRVYRSFNRALVANVSFTQLAQESGFGNSSSYSRTVRRLLGAAPTKILPRGENYKRELALFSPGLSALLDRGSTPKPQRSRPHSKSRRTFQGKRNRVKGNGTVL